MTSHDFTINTVKQSGPVVPIESPVKKYILPYEREQNKCFKCSANRTGQAFINNQIMNVCIPCRTVWPMEGDTKNFGELPLEDQVKGTVFFHGIRVT